MFSPMRVAALSQNVPNDHAFQGEVAPDDDPLSGFAIQEAAHQARFGCTKPTLKDSRTYLHTDPPFQSNCKSVV